MRWELIRTRIQIQRQYYLNTKMDPLELLIILLMVLKNIPKKELKSIHKKGQLYLIISGLLLHLDLKTLES